MALDKSIAHKKEKRKPYTKAKAISPDCRNHGSCDFCKKARLFSRRKKEQIMIQELKDWSYHNFSIGQLVQTMFENMILSEPFIILDISPIGNKILVMDEAAYIAGEESTPHNSGWESSVNFFAAERKN